MNEKNSTDYFLEAYKIWQEMCSKNKTTETMLINELRSTKFYLNSIDKPREAVLAKAIEHILQLNYAVLKIYNLCNLLPMMFADSEDKDTKERFTATCGFDAEKELLMAECTTHLMSARELIELHWLGEDMPEEK